MFCIKNSTRPFYYQILSFQAYSGVHEDDIYRNLNAIPTFLTLDWLSLSLSAPSPLCDEHWHFPQRVSLKPKQLAFMSFSALFPLMDHVCNIKFGHIWFFLSNYLLLSQHTITEYNAIIRHGAGYPACEVASSWKTSIKPSCTITSQPREIQYLDLMLFQWTVGFTLNQRN